MSNRLLNVFELLRSLSLPVGDYAVFGSGPLIIRGIVKATNDLDVISRGEAWRVAAQNAEVVHLSEHDVTVVSLFDGAVTVGTEWAIGEFDVDELIDTAELIEGIPFVQLEHVVAYKRIPVVLRTANTSSYWRQAAPNGRRRGRSLSPPGARCAATVKTGSSTGPSH